MRDEEDAQSEGVTWVPVKVSVKSRGVQSKVFISRWGDLVPAKVKKK